MIAGHRVIVDIDSSKVGPPSLINLCNGYPREVRGPRRELMMTVKLRLVLHLDSDSPHQYGCQGKGENPKLAEAGLNLLRTSGVVERLH